MQMKNDVNSEKGSMAVYAIVTILSFIIILTGVYTATAAVRRNQLRTMAKIKEVYKENSDKKREIYDEVAKNFYISNGLLLHYDAINNVGEGDSNRSTTAITWRDLSGNENDGIFSGATWNKNGLYLSGSNSGVVTSNTIDFTVNSTFEIVLNGNTFPGFALDARYDSGTPNGEGYQPLYLYENGKKAQTDANDSGGAVESSFNSIKDSIHSMVVVYSNNGTKVYLDGKNIATLDTLNGIAYTGNLYIGKKFNNEQYLTGTIYSCRYYNVALTEEEVRHNYEIDKVRFDIDETAHSVSEEETAEEKQQKEETLEKIATVTVANNNLNNNAMKNISGGNATSVTGIVKATSLPNNDSVVVTKMTNGDSNTYLWCEDGILQWWSNDVTPQFPSNCEKLFDGFNQLEDLSGLADWDTSHMGTTFEMFRNCKSITTLKDLAKWDLSNVTNMKHAFQNCSALKTLEGVENWNVSNVTDMQTLFGNCNELTDISALRGWGAKTSKVTDMSGMFQNDTKLVDLSPLETWNTSSVTSTKQMFKQCTSLENLYGLKDWNMAKNQNMEEMFYKCTKIPSGMVDLENKKMGIEALSSWKTPSLTNMKNAFAQLTISSVTTFRDWDVSRVTNFASVFDNCQSIASLEGLGGWDVSKATTFNAMFYNNKKITDATAIANWKVSESMTFTNMFKVPYGKPTSLPDFKIDGKSGTWNESDGTWTPPVAE